MIMLTTKSQVMKKVFILFWSVFCCVALIGQTYFYEFECFVDSDTGVKSGSSNPASLHRYITFTNNKSVCYFSDEKGLATGKESSSGIGYLPPMWQGGVKYKYTGTKNGRYVYESIETYSMYGYGNMYTGEQSGYFKIYDTKKYLYFSSDYSRVNAWTDPYHYMYSAPNNNAIKMTMNIYREANTKNTSYTITVYNKTKSPEERKKNGPDVFY